MNEVVRIDWLTKIDKLGVYNMFLANWINRKNGNNWY